MVVLLKNLELEIEYLEKGCSYKTLISVFTKLFFEETGMQHPQQMLTLDSIYHI